MLAVAGSLWAVVTCVYALLFFGHEQVLYHGGVRTDPDAGAGCLSFVSPSLVLHGGRYSAYAAEERGKELEYATGTSPVDGPSEAVARYSAVEAMDSARSSSHSWVDDIAAGECADPGCEGLACDASAPCVGPEHVVGYEHGGMAGVDVEIRARPGGCARDTSRYPSESFLKR